MRALLAGIGLMLLMDGRNALHASSPPLSRARALPHVLQLQPGARSQGVGAAGTAMGRWGVGGRAEHGVMRLCGGACEDTGGTGFETGVNDNTEEFEVSVGGVLEEGEEEERGEAEVATGAGGEELVCEFERIGDTNGVIYALGQRHAEERGTVRYSEQTGKRLFVNPAKEGRVRVLAGPMRCVCSVKLEGKAVHPEDVLQRNVVGDEFWFPDGWFAVDLGNHTSLRPTHYMMRNGGGKAEVTTGWMLEAASEVDGKWWRVGDWQVLDSHENTSAFSDLADQVQGYTHETSPPTAIDPKTGQEVCTIPMQLMGTWQATPIGEKPHHTLCFKVHTDRHFRYFRLRQKTHARHTHDDVGCSSNNFYVQGFELYGHLVIGHKQREMPLFEWSCEPAQWYLGHNNPEEWDQKGKYDELQWLRDGVDRSEWDIESEAMMERYLQRLRDSDMDTPRGDDEVDHLIAKYGNIQDYDASSDEVE